MKKIIISIIAALAMTATFTACGSDDDGNISYSTTAEKASAGTYTGTFTRTLEDEVVEFAGTVTLEAADRAGVTYVTFSCPDASLEATSIANVWNSNYDFQFMQQTKSDDNGLGEAFAGRISQAGQLVTAFTIEQTVGRKKYKYAYEFVGQKQ